MVAIRKRPSVENPAASSPLVTAEAVMVDAPSAASVPASDDRETLRRRLAELESVERNAEALRQRQAEIAAQMVKQQRPPEMPKLSQRDLEFIGARPGIEKDPRLAHMANGLEGAGIAYGSNRFYELLESAFPLSDYRRTEPEPKPTPAPTPAPAAAPVAAANNNGPFAKPETNIDSLMLAESRRMEDPAREPVRYTNASIVSAPPTRESLSLGTGRPMPGRVVLTRDERDLARSCGVSEVEWAKGKQKMEARRKAGLLQDENDR
jgi:hypothetical protein